MEGIFFEMDRGGVKTHSKRQSCAYCQYSNLPAHWYRLISLSFVPFIVCSKKEIVVVVLLFYVNGKHLRSCQDGQLT